MANSNNPKCYYHTSRDAITKCEMCGKVICVECKNIFQEVHSTGTSDQFHSHYAIRRELCTPCYCDKGIKTAKISRVIPIVFGIFMLLMGIIYISVSFYMISSFSGGLDDPFMYSMFIPDLIFPIIGGVIIVIGIVFYSRSGRKIANLEAKKTEFLNSVALAPSSKARTQPSKREYCPHCGSKINRAEKICEQCGEEI